MEEEQINIVEQQISKIKEDLQVENFPALYPIKEEMTIIGYCLLKKKFKTYVNSWTFAIPIARDTWKKIVDSKFKISEDELESNLLYNYKDISVFLKASKELALNTTEDEYLMIVSKIDKVYNVRAICDDMYWQIDDKDEKENFKFKVSIIAESERIFTLSLKKIEKLLKSYNEQSFNDIIVNSNSLPQNLTSFLDNKTKRQDKGIPLPFVLIDKAINGLRKGQLLATGMMSNDGKTRLMVRLVANLSIIQNKKVLIISNEMTEEDIKYAFITSIINNTEFKDMLKDISITKTEREIRNGIYATEYEQQQVKQITAYIEEKFSNNVIVIHTTQYSSKDLKDIILTHYLENSIDYFFYDTLKADIDTMSNWDGLKATGTVLSELAKEYNICIWANIQLVNSPQPLQANVDNIANSRQLYHILDTLLLFIPIPKNEYTDFRYWASSENPNNDNIQKLDTSKKYYACSILKNRIGAKPNLLFEVNLDLNTWEEVGQIARYKDVKRFLE